MNEFTLRLADGRWVSSPSNTVTSNPNLAGVFTAADHKSAAVLRRAIERIHGPLEVVPWQSKRTDALPRHGEHIGVLGAAQDLFADTEMLQKRQDALAEVQIIATEVLHESGLKAPALITYPARPIQGGRLELAPPKRGLWYAEPKLNGWRALIHTPSGTMWNRHGTLLTIADCFRPALASLANLASRGLVWADCEALERRHNLCRGTLVVLDLIPESGTPIYTARRAMLESLLPCDPAFDGDSSCPVPSGAALLTPTRRVDSPADAVAYYQQFRDANRSLGCDFFEGVVMKRADSAYPVAAPLCDRRIPWLGEASVSDLKELNAGSLSAGVGVVLAKKLPAEIGQEEMPHQWGIWSTVESEDAVLATVNFHHRAVTLLGILGRARTLAVIRGQLRAGIRCVELRR